MMIILMMLLLLLVPLTFTLPFPPPVRSSPTNYGCAASEKCGSFDSIPYPFHLNNASDRCESHLHLSDAFRLSCSNSTSLFLNIGSHSYQVLHFFPDGGSLLVDFPTDTTPYSSPHSSSSCHYYDLSSFGFQGNDHFSISTDNVLALYGCDDSSMCMADCGGCDNDNTTIVATSTVCCYYRLSSDRRVWRVGDSFSVFSQFGCRGFSCWVGSGTNDAASVRGIKLEWAVPSNLIKGACDPNAQIVNVTSVMFGMRCRCLDGFVGDGFSQGTGCLKSCLKDGEEAYGRDCYMKRHGRRKLVVIAGILTSGLSVAALTALFCLLKRHTMGGTFDLDQSNGQSIIPFKKGSTTCLFTYNELEEATKGFGDDQKLVDIGDRGTIYTGVLRDGSQVAVHKRQCACQRDLMQVLSRVKILLEVSHRSMARILGYSIDSGYSLLVVYEYPGNGTLEQHLCQSVGERKIGIDWHKRLNIAAQTASILAFLQCQIFPPVFHHSVQSGCILLDEQLSVKIAGFELLGGDRCESDLCSKADDQGRGTCKVYSRNDVYSMGVVLLEIIAGNNISLDLLALALQKIRSGKIEELVDPSLYYHEQPGYRKEQIEIVADLATRCLLFGGDGKLSIHDVARELVHIMKENIDHVGSRRGPVSLEETFSNSSLLQMISMSPDSIYIS